MYMGFQVKTILFSYYKTVIINVLPGRLHPYPTAAFSHAIASLITFGMPCPRDVAAVALIKNPIFFNFMHR